MPHSIRLRGPWNYQPLIRFLPLASGQLRGAKENVPRGGTLELPADWGGVLRCDFQGVVRFTRRFHRPTGLHAASRVWLLVDDVDWRAVVTLNERALGSVVSKLATESGALRCPARFDITADLLPQNLLSIDVTSPSLTANGFPLPRPGREDQPGGPIGLVRLEIE